MKPLTPTGPAEMTLNIISGRWKFLILYYLYRGTRRFSELRRSIPGVTQKMLTQQLREMERDGLIRRKVYAQIPPRVEYSLTTLGRSLHPILNAMCDWGKKHGAQLISRLSASHETDPQERPLALSENALKRPLP